MITNQLHDLHATEAGIAAEALIIAESQFCGGHGNAGTHAGRG
jgi:hypothetical protein